MADPVLLDGLRRCGVVSFALSRQPYPSSTSLRRQRLRVAAQASRTSRSRCICSSDVEASRITSCRQACLLFAPLALSPPPCHRWCQALRRRKAACTFHSHRIVEMSGKVVVGTVSSPRRVAQFRRRLYSIVQRADPLILVDRGTVAPQMEPSTVNSDV